MIVGQFKLKRSSYQNEGEQTYLLDDVSEISENLLNHQSSLDQMDKSVYSQHFTKDIEFWKGNLTLIDKVVDEWMNGVFSYCYMYIGQGGT